MNIYRGCNGGRVEGGASQIQNTMPISKRIGWGGRRGPAFGGWVEVGEFFKQYQLPKGDWVGGGGGRVIAKTNKTNTPHFSPSLSIPLSLSILLTA